MINRFQFFHAVGDCYYYGRGVEKNQVRAVEYYRKAADLGLASAQYNLGFCYEHGYGILHSRRNAIYWYTKASEQGNKGAAEALERLNKE